MVGARSASRSTLGVTLDPSGDHLPRTVVEGEGCARFGGALVARGDEGRDSQPDPWYIVDSRSSGLEDGRLHEGGGPGVGITWFATDNCWDSRNIAGDGDTDTPGIAGQEPLQKQQELKFSALPLALPPTTEPTRRSPRS